MNMVTQIIYLGRVEVGDWQHAVFFFRYLCNGFYGSLDLVLTSAYNLSHNNGKCWRQHADVSIILTTQWWKVLTSAYHLSRPEWLLDRDYIFCLCVCVWCPENVKAFEWTILRSSVMNMITQIIYLGRAEVGDWQHAVVVFLNIFLWVFTAVWT